jgi:hypothetical protein
VPLASTKRIDDQFPDRHADGQTGGALSSQNYLTEQYDGGHEVFFVRSASGGQDTNVTATRVSALDDLKPDVHQGASLFVPPRDAPSMDKQCVAMMHDRAQLARHFAPS